MYVCVMSAGIYTIQNACNLKIYVGSAKIISQRWNQHRHNLRKGNHCNKHLQSSWNKYGEASFVFSIVELCEVEHLMIREQHHIDTISPEYNKNPIAGRGYGRKVSEETRQKLSVARRARSITAETVERIRLSMLGKNTRAIVASNASEVLSFDSLLEAVKQLKLPGHTGISRALRGKRKTYRGYKWEYQI